MPSIVAAAATPVAEPKTVEQIVADFTRRAEPGLFLAASGRLNRGRGETRKYQIVKVAKASPEAPAGKFVAINTDGHKFGKAKPLAELLNKLNRNGFELEYFTTGAEQRAFVYGR